MRYSHVKSPLFWYSYPSNPIMNCLLIILFVMVVYKMHVQMQKRLHKGSLAEIYILIHMTVVYLRYLKRVAYYSFTLIYKLLE